LRLPNNRLVSLIFAVCTVLYLAQIIFFKPDQATLRRYHLTVTSDILLSLAIAIPYVIIWIIALVGYQRLYKYARTIEGSKDGNAFKLLTAGVLLFSIWLPITTVLGTLVTHSDAFHISKALATHINNYANILMLLAAFITTFVGSRRLVRMVRSWRLPSNASLYATLAFIAFSSCYTWLVLHDPVRRTPTGDIRAASYYETDWLILTTIIIPRLIAWFFGIQTVMNLYLYSSKVNGNLYRAALTSLANGIGTIVLVAIVLRFFQSITPTLTHLSLGLLILVIYALLILMAVGYVFVAKGAKSMQMLEEI
jgi:hypothetical protein